MWPVLDTGAAGEIGEDIMPINEFNDKPMAPFWHKNSGNFNEQLVERKVVVKESRKPSERFLRRPLKARSRASGSERMRMLDLSSKLVNKIDITGVSNAHAQFNGYKPGQNGISE